MPKQNMPSSTSDWLNFANKVHQANYGVFRATTEEGAIAAVDAILRMSPCAAGYYRLGPAGFERASAATAPRGGTLGWIPENIAASPDTISLLHSPGFTLRQTSGDPDLPAALRGALQQAGYSVAAFVPVVEGGELSGLILFAGQPDQRLQRESLDPFISLAEVLPIALDKIRAEGAVQQRLRELEGIAAVGRAIATAADLGGLYRIIHRQIRETIGEVDLIFAIYEKSTNTIQIPYRYEEGEVSTLEAFPLGEGLTSILIRTGQPLMIVEDTEKRTAELGAKIVGKPARSWLGCPLLVGGEAIGAVIIQDTSREGRFTEDHLRFISSLAGQTAGAVYNARLLDEAQQRALQLETAAEIARDVSGSLLVDELLQKSVNLIRDRFKFYHAAIFLVDPSGGSASIREASGTIGAQMKNAGHKLQIGSESVVGTVTSKGESLIVNETSSAPVYFANPLLPDTRSEAGIPIMLADRVIGALDVQSTVPHAFNDENVKILRILADQVAIAIVNSELFSEAQERLSQHRLLHRITTSAASSTTLEEALNTSVQGLQVTLGGDHVAILLLGSDGETLEVKSAVGYTDDIYTLRIPVGMGISGWAAEHRQALRVPDVTQDPRYVGRNEGTRCELAIPLIYRNDLLGVLNLESDRANAYNESLEEMMGTLCGSLAAIIAHARLLEQFRQQIENDRLLYEITTKIRRSSDIQVILETTAREISRAVGTRRTRVSVEVGQRPSPEPVTTIE